MSTSVGLNVNEQSLVFAFDISDPASYKGEPTENLAYYTSTFLDSGSNWWINGGGAEFNDNDTSIDKPYIPNVNTTNLRVFSAKTTSLPPNQHIGSRIIPVSPNTEYTFSIWFYYTGTSMQAPPYVRGAVGNYNIADFVRASDYNTNYLEWPRSKWVLLKAVFRTDASETGVYMSSYIGDSVGEKVAYFGYQLEQKGHMTPLALPLRGNTESLFDTATGKRLTINCSFDPEGVPIFDGSNDYIDIDSNNLVEGYDEFTVEVIYNLNGGSGVIIGNYGPGYYSNSVWVYSGGMYLNSSYGYTSNPTGKHHLVCQRTKQGYFKTYRNGTLVTNNNGGFPAFIASNIGWRIGVDVNSTSSEPFNGSIYMIRVYKRILSQAEITDNYNSYKSRFNI